jgi:fructose-bisphosphate aldolase / 2-amino-3,7-dideoxy-D-threo-hept-6-ulosonate synthase
VNAVPVRLRRITNPKTDRALLLSFTAGLELGIVPGLADLPNTLDAFAKTGLLSAAVVHAGVSPSIFARIPDLACGLIVDLFGGTWMTTRPDRREQICSLEHAVRVGADAVLATIGLGSADESHHLRLCGQLVRDANAWGMPVVLRIDTTQTDARRQYAATLSGHGARLAYELGADLVVVNYSDSGPAFADALRGVPIPVLIGGGPRMETNEALLASVAQALQHGASGVMLSAPLFWQDGPTETLAQLAKIVGA